MRNAGSSVVARPRLALPQVIFARQYAITSLMMNRHSTPVQMAHAITTCHRRYATLTRAGMDQVVTHERKQIMNKKTLSCCKSDE